MIIREKSFEIRPVTPADLETLLELYRQCEDFLALGPVATASMEMVLKDIQISRDEGGLYCSLHLPDGKMIGVVDYIPNNYHGDPHSAYLSLLMIAAPFRGQGLGKAVLEAVEAEIQKDAGITTIFLGAQANNPRAVQFWQNNGYRIIAGPKLLPDQTVCYDFQKDLPRKK